MKRKTTKIIPPEFHNEKEIYLKDKLVDRVTDSGLCFLLQIKFCFFIYRKEFTKIYFNNLQDFDIYQKFLFTYRKKLKASR
jgi:hypothetical protein